jgi:pimeloyl-ACP methyl ester carboxylesterase
VAIGHSAGGHLALWAGARRKVAKQSPIGSADPLPIAGVVSLAGIADLKAYRGDGPSACGGPDTIDSIAGATRGGDPYFDTSPAAMAPLGVPQAVISGALDPIVPPKFGRDYAMAATGAGDKVRELTIEGAGHFELIDPTSDAWAKIRLETDILTGAHRHQTNSQQKIRHGRPLEPAPSKRTSVRARESFCRADTRRLGGGSGPAMTVFF